MAQSVQTVINPPLLTVKEAADYLRICRVTLYGMLDQLQTIRIGSRRLIYRDSLDRFIAAQLGKAA